MRIEFERRELEGMLQLPMGMRVKEIKARVKGVDKVVDLEALIVETELMEVKLSRHGESGIV